MVDILIRIALILFFSAIGWTILASLIENRLASDIHGRPLPSARTRTLLTLFRNALAVVISKSQSAPEDPPQEYPLYPPLAPGEAPRGLEGGVAAEIARYALRDDGPGAAVNGWRTTEKTLYFGAGLAPSQVAGPFAIRRYGRTFRERRVYVRVTNEHPHSLALRQIALQHQPLVQANPLLLQLDWVNLIPVLDGLPVALLERGRQVTLRLVLKDPSADFYRPTP